MYDEINLRVGLLVLILIPVAFGGNCIARMCALGCCRDLTNCATKVDTCASICENDGDCGNQCCVGNYCQNCPSSNFQIPQPLVYVLIISVAVLTIGVCTYAIYREKKRRDLKRMRNLIGQG
jgi:hypothetical protein